jgi:hypothetical protein
MDMRAADVNVQFPSGVKTVNLIRLLALAQHAETKARFGMGLARNAPTLAAIRAEFEIPRSAAPTWEAVAPLLRRFHTDLSEAIR